MKQHPLTVLVPVKPDAVGAVLEHLRPIGENVERNAFLRFRESPSTHFARFALLNHDPKRGPRLLFSSNHDGPLAAYADELARTVGAGLDGIFQHCRGYAPATAMNGADLLEFLRPRRRRTQAFYVASPGASVADIHASIRNREALDDALDGPDRRKALAKLKPLVPPGRPPRRVSAGAAQALVERLGFVVERMAGIRVAPPGLHRRMVVRPDLIDIEDRVVQNQMTIVSPVKRGWWPRTFVKLALVIAALASKRAKGSLSGVTTIHFARWVLIDDGEYLLFESNYDGSWENYIDDFVDFASTGMNVVWGTAVDFPRGGCRDIEAFKHVIRQYQLPTQVFYSAYPRSTVANNINDLGLARAIETGVPSERVRRFLTGAFASA